MKIGIVCDNYKLDKFRKELIDEGFTDFTTAPFTSESTTIAVITSSEKVSELKKLCEKVEFHFKHAN